MILFVVLSLALLLSNWLPLVITRTHKYGFIDIESVLQSAKCYKIIGFDVFNASGTKCSGYIYGSYLLNFINATNLSSHSGYLIGLITMFLISILLAILASNFQLKFSYPVGYIVVLIFSPGLWFLLERGNIDGWIFILLFISFSLLKSNQFLSFLMIFVSAIFKFYTLPVLLIFLLTARGRFVRSIIFSLLILATAIIIKDLKLIESDFPFTIYTSFGSPAIGLFLRETAFLFQFNLLKISDFHAHFIGLFCFIWLTIIVYRLIPGYASTFAANNSIILHYNYRESLIFVFGTSFLSCYVLGMNYDYRLILASISALALDMDKFPDHMIKLFKVIIVLALWLSAFSFGLTGKYFIVLSFVGDFCIGILASLVLLELMFLIRIHLSGSRGASK
jgi:hypothetical protein